MLSFHSGKSELVSVVSNSICLYAKRALDEKQKELNHRLKPTIEVLAPSLYVEKIMALYHLCDD